MKSRMHQWKEGGFITRCAVLRSIVIGRIDVYLENRSITAS